MFDETGTRVPSFALLCPTAWIAKRDAPVECQLPQSATVGRNRRAKSHGFIGMLTADDPLTADHDEHADALTAADRDRRGRTTGRKALSTSTIHTNCPHDAGPWQVLAGPGTLHNDGTPDVGGSDGLSSDRFRSSESADCLRRQPNGDKEMVTRSSTHPRGPRDPSALLGATAGFSLPGRFVQDVGSTLPFGLLIHQFIKQTRSGDGLPRQFDPLSAGACRINQH